MVTAHGEVLDVIDGGSTFLLVVNLGRRIVERLIGWLQTHAPERAFVGLFAAEGKDSFYAHFGFMRHPALTGMFLVMPRLQEEYE